MNKKIENRDETASCEQIFTEIGQADPVVVKEVVDVLIDALNKWLETHDLEFIDAFMVAHNFHKLMIINIAETMKDAGMDLSLFMVAEETWSMAMRETVAGIIRRRSGN